MKEPKVEEHYSAFTDIKVEADISVDDTPLIVQKPLSELGIVHRDNCRKNTYRGRSQQGTLHVALHKLKDSACVECVMCNEMFSIKKFMRHQHPHNRPEELLEVTLPQRLELLNNSPSEEESCIWTLFKSKQKDLQSVSLKHRSPKVLSSNKMKMEYVSVVSDGETLNDSGVVCEQSNDLNNVTTDHIKQEDIKYIKVENQPLCSISDIRSVPPKRRSSNRSMPTKRLSKSPGISHIRNSLDTDSDIRHSKRVRKRKQMDEFVYNSTTTPSPTGQTAKKPRLSLKDEGNMTIAHNQTDLPPLTSTPRSTRFPRRSRGSLG